MDRFRGRLTSLSCGLSQIDCSSVWPVIAVAYFMSVAHAVMGALSIVIGILSTINAEVWMAHRVSPIWSGGFYLLTALVGVMCARKKTAYLVMCFGAMSMVSMVVAVVCIQLARLGLVTHLSDGDTHRQEQLDVLVILALVTSGMEILICILTFPVTCRMVSKVKEEVHMKRDGTFSIQVLGDKDIIIHQSETSGSYERLAEDETVTNLVQISKLSVSCASRINADIGATNQRAELSAAACREERLRTLDKTDRIKKHEQRLDSTKLLV